MQGAPGSRRLSPRLPQAGVGMPPFVLSGAIGQNGADSSQALDSVQHMVSEAPSCPTEHEIEVKETK